MVKINVEKKEENVEYKPSDYLLLTRKNTKEFCLAIITEHCIDSKKRYDLTMLSEDNCKYCLNQWNNISPYKTIESLINSVEESYEITKLEEDQFEINIDVKL